jgi:probable F420-dependent oxidoreductase
MAHARPLRFAVQLLGAPDGPTWASLAQRAEADGFDVVSLPDHLGEQFAPLPALTAAACATTGLRLSMFVPANDMRHPGVLAKEVATLDVLSGGRVELGLGAGLDQHEYAALGVPFDRPSVRIARLEEAVLAIRALLAGEVVSARGEHYALRGLSVRPRPVQAGGVPIVLEGAGADALVGRPVGRHRQRGHREQWPERPDGARTGDQARCRGGAGRVGARRRRGALRAARAEPAGPDCRRRH